jgi:hypothetical protein
MTEHYFTFEVRAHAPGCKLTFHPRKALPVDISLHIPPAM